MIFTVGLGTLVLGGAFTLAGLPAPAEVVHGAPEVTPSVGPSRGPIAPGPVLGPVAPSDGPTDPRRPLSEHAMCTRGPGGLQPATVAYHGPRDAKVVALTFDDGWGGRSLEKIVRILRDRRVNATFFPVGQAVRQDPGTWRRIADAGFPIADHTIAHGTLKGRCFSDQRQELVRARAVYAELLGVTPLPVMRPPGGLFDDATLVAATSAGESSLVLWDVDSSDWTGIRAAQIRRNALAGTKGSIVVLHTSSWATVHALPGIIRGYRQRGYDFVTVGQLLGLDGTVPFPPEDAPAQIGG